MSPDLRIAAIYPQLMLRMGRLRTLVHDGLDLTYNQYKTLLTVAEHGTCSLGDLAKELEVAMSSASQMIDRLVTRELVERNQDASNRRQVNIRLTQKGEKLLADWQQSVLKRYEQVLAQLPPDDRNQLASSLENINRILGRLAGNKGGPR